MAGPTSRFCQNPDFPGFGRFGAKVGLSGRQSGRFWPEPRFWPESCRKCSGQRFWLESQKSKVSAKIRDFGQNSRFSEISRFLGFCSCQNAAKLAIPSCYMSSINRAHVHIRSQKQRPSSICTACSLHAWHMYTYIRVKGKLMYAYI